MQSRARELLYATLQDSGGFESLRPKNRENWLVKQKFERIGKSYSLALRGAAFRLLFYVDQSARGEPCDFSGQTITNHAFQARNNGFVWMEMWWHISSISHKPMMSHNI